MSVFKFGQVEVASKDFHSTYQVTDIESIDLDKITVSEGVVVNKHDMRYTIGYEVEPGKIIPLYIKTPKNCLSSGVSRYNENSARKMGFNVGEDPTWIKQYEAIWWRIVEFLHAPGCGGFEMGGTLSGSPLNNEKYINPKLITWDEVIKTKFYGSCGVPYDKHCYATGVLKIGSVYKQGSNYYLQVFLKECKYREREGEFQSQLSDDEEWL